MREFFDGAELCLDVNPNDGVAIGAAMMAGNMAGQVEDSATFIVREIVPKTIGLELDDDEFLPIIFAGTTLPVAIEGPELTTSQDNCDIMMFDVRAGSSNKASENVLVEKSAFGGYPKGPAGTNFMTPIFSVDESSIIRVSARITNADGRKEVIQVLESQCETARLTEEELQDLIA